MTGCVLEARTPGMNVRLEPEGRGRDWQADPVPPDLPEKHQWMTKARIQRPPRCPLERRRWTMTSNNHDTVAKYWGDFWSKGDLSVAEEIFDPDFRDHDPNCPWVKPGREG